MLARKTSDHHRPCPDPASRPTDQQPHEWADEEPVGICEEPGAGPWQASRQPECKSALCLEPRQGCGDDHTKTVEADAHGQEGKEQLLKGAHVASNCNALPYLIVRR